MEENRKGPGIFYAVVGVATLVVAIIGATFAYFSAQAEVTGEENLTGTTATTGNLTLAVAKVLPSSNETPLIPLDSDKKIGETTTTYLAHALTKDKLCRDNNEDVVCHVYSFTLTNGASANLMTTTKLSLAFEDSDGDPVVYDGTEGKENHWRWQLVTGDATNGFTVVADSSAITTVATPTVVGSDLLAATNAENDDDEVVYHVVVWLDDPGDDQPETGITYRGTVTAQSTDAQGNTSGITATFE